MMAAYEIIRIQERPQWKDVAAKWFHSKWGVPLEAYRESMEASLSSQTGVPAWYLCLHENAIIAGMGVIENDFHSRKDLTPNICAVYTEEKYRCQGIAGKLLDFVCKDLKAKGIDTVYLLTDHVGLYEKYGWEFLCMVPDDEESSMARMYVHKEP